MSEVPMKPQPLPARPEHIPPELRSLRQWCLWRYEYRPESSPEKPWTKPPFQVNGRGAKSNDRQTWTSFDEVIRHLAQFDGLGFVFSESDPYVGIDLDGCRHPLDGFIQPWAREIICELASYTEASVSGTGVHILVKGDLPPGGRKKGGFEIYKLGRYFTMSGHHLPDTPLEIHNRQAAIDALHQKIFGNPKGENFSPEGPTIEVSKVSEAPFATFETATSGGRWQNPVLSNVEGNDLLERMFSAKNGEQVRRLWNGDASDHGEDDSAADLALCAHLAFWTGRDAGRMDGLFRQSGLFRDKWDVRHFPDGRTYGEATIQKALEGAGPHFSSNGHDSASFLAEPDQPWPERREITERPAVPLLPEAMVPAPFRDWLRDIASRACIPLEMVACPALTAVAAVVGRQMGIRPSRHDYYLVVPNLWGGGIARPGAMKTYGNEEGIKPLRFLAVTARDRHQAEVEANSSRLVRVKAEIEAIKGEMVSAAKGKGDKTLDDLEQALTIKQRELQEIVATERRYLTQDATLEKLGELLRDNPRGLMVYRDELAGWLHTLDRAGREGDREFYLESWNGTGSYTTDRIGRGTIHIPSTCLSIYGGIQPGKLAAYVREAIAGGEGADGLLQRIQLMVWPDGLGKWDPPDSPPDRAAYERAREIFNGLDDINTNLFPVEQDEGGIPALRFSHEAQELFDQWRTELEHRVRSKSLFGKGEG